MSCEPLQRRHRGSRTSLTLHLRFSGHFNATLSLWLDLVRFHVNLDVNVTPWRRRHTELHLIIPDHSKVAALGRGNRMKRRARRLVRGSIRKQPLKREGYRHDPAYPSNREGSVHGPLAARRLADAASLVRHRRKLPYVEEVRPAQVIVALGELRAYAKRVDCDVERACRRILRYSDCARGVVKPAAHQPDDVVPGTEVHKTMDWIDLVGSRSGQRRRHLRLSFPRTSTTRCRGLVAQRPACSYP